MKISAKITHFLLRFALRTFKSREPNLYIGAHTDENGTRVGTYLERWYVIPRNPVFNIYLHRFLRSDVDFALHDHPWSNLSILLLGSYIEHTKTGQQLLCSGDLRFRPSGTFAHRVALINDQPCVTLFITGPRYRTWGFHCKSGWKSWKTMKDPNSRPDC